MCFYFSNDENPKQLSMSKSIKKYDEDEQAGEEEEGEKNSAKARGLNGLRVVKF